MIQKSSDLKVIYFQHIYSVRFPPVKPPQVKFIARTVKYPWIHSPSLRLQPGEGTIVAAAAKIIYLITGHL